MEAEALRALLDARACERLLVEYVRRVDFGEAASLADLFVEDGVWEAEGLVLDGREAIRAHFLQRQGVVRRVSRHMVTNVAVDVDGDAASGLAYFANFRVDRAEGDLSLPVAAGLAKYTGEYVCAFARGAEGWRFARLHVDVTFLRPATPAPQAV
ncbi:MAG: nuclear transport factor 2 family protein [Conexibacter sp.]|nr:nuclear transport factor 2 family protein [Conexibacter sp.]